MSLLGRARLLLLQPRYRVVPSNSGRSNISSCIRSTQQKIQWKRHYAIQFDPQYAEILKLDLKAQFARDRIAAMRGHEHGVTEAIRLIKENVTRWEKKHERSAKDADIVQVMLDMAHAELFASLQPKNSPWATDVILTDTDRLVRTIKRYLPEQYNEFELPEKVLDAVRSSAELPRDDLLAATRIIVDKLGARAMPREVYKELQKILK